MRLYKQRFHFGIIQLQSLGNFLERILQVIAHRQHLRLLFGEHAFGNERLRPGGAVQLGRIRECGFQIGDALLHALGYFIVRDAAEVVGDTLVIEPIPQAQPDE